MEDGIQSLYVYSQLIRWMGPYKPNVDHISKEFWAVWKRKIKFIDNYRSINRFNENGRVKFFQNVLRKFRFLNYKEKYK